MSGKRKGFMNERAIAFFPSLAKRVGSSDKALILQQIYYITLGKEEHGDKAFFHEGKWWFYGSYEEIRVKFFEWIPLGTFKRHILDLETVGVIVSREYEGDQRIKWYSLANEEWTNAWFDRTLEDDNQLLVDAGRRKPAKSPKKKADHFDPEMWIKMIRYCGSKRSVFWPPVYIVDSNIKASSNISHSNTTESPSSDSTLLPGDPPALDRDGDDDVSALIQKCLDFHQVGGDAREEFETMDQETALSWLYSADLAVERKADNAIGVVIANMRAGRKPEQRAIEAAQRSIIKRRGEINLIELPF